MTLTYSATTPVTCLLLSFHWHCAGCTKVDSTYRRQQRGVSQQLQRRCVLRRSAAAEHRARAPACSGSDESVIAARRRRGSVLSGARTTGAADKRVAASGHLEQPLGASIPARLSFQRQQASRRAGVELVSSVGSGRRAGCGRPAANEVEDRWPV